MALPKLASMAPAAGSVMSGLGNSAITSGVQAAGSMAGANTVSEAGTGQLGNFPAMMSSFMANSQQSLQDQVAMQNAQLQVNQEQQIASQTAKTAQGSIDKMDVK